MWGLVVGAVVGAIGARTTPPHTTALRVATMVHTKLVMWFGADTLDLSAMEFPDRGFPEVASRRQVVD